MAALRIRREHPPVGVLVLSQYVESQKIVNRMHVLVTLDGRGPTGDGIADGHGDTGPRAFGNVDPAAVLGDRPVQGMAHEQVGGRAHRCR